MIPSEHVLVKAQLVHARVPSEEKGAPVHRLPEAS